MALSVAGLAGPQLTKIRAAIDQLQQGQYPAGDSDQAVVDAYVKEHLNGLHVTSDYQINAGTDRTAREAAARTDLAL